MNILTEFFNMLPLLDEWYLFFIAVKIFFLFLVLWVIILSPLAGLIMGNYFEKSFDKTCRNITVVLGLITIGIAGYTLSISRFNTISAIEMEQLSAIEMEQLARSEMAYRLGKEGRPNTSAFTHISDKKLISFFENLRENNREANLILETFYDKVSKVPGSLEDKRTRVKQVLEEREAINKGEFFKASTPKEKERYIRTLKSKKKQVEDLLRRIRGGK